jgi:hypothetical protein
MSAKMLEKFENILTKVLTVVVFWLSVILFIFLWIIYAFSAVWCEHVLIRKKS